jgi:hypothetical protein
VGSRGRTDSRLSVPWLNELERSFGDSDDEGDLATALVVLASLGGAQVRVEEAEKQAATRRALLLLTAGGDPARGLDLNGRAVESLADDLRTVDRQIALEQGIANLRLEAQGLAHVSEALHALADAPEIAWRAYAAALLAEELGGVDEAQ